MSALIRFSQEEVRYSETLHGPYWVNLLSCFYREPKRYNPNTRDVEIFVHANSDVATEEGRQKFLKSSKEYQNLMRLNL